MTEALTSSRRLAKNTIMMYIRMGITMLVGLITTRLVLQSLGAEDFGLYNAVSGIVILITFLNNALMIATQRYYSYAIGERNKEKLQEIFNASIFIYIAIILIIIIVGETLGLWFLNTKMVFTETKVGLANFVYQFSLLITCFNIIRTPFNSLFVASEKMDFYAFLAVVEAIIHLVFVFILVCLPLNPSYVYIVFQSLSAFFILLWIVAYFRKNYGKYIKISVISDKKLFKDLLSFSSWGIWGSMAVIGFQQGINILLNIFFGVTVNAAFGIANRVNAFINNFFTGFQTAANPQITKAYASGDVANLMILINRTTKISFFLLLLFGTVAIYNLEFLLIVWLKEIPDYTILLSRLMIIGAIIDSLSSPLYVTIYATGRIRVYQITISFILLLNIFISFVLFDQGYSIEYCMYVRIVIFILAYIVRLLFVKAYTKVEIKRILKEAILPILIISVIILILVLMTWNIKDIETRVFIITPMHIVVILSLITFIGFSKKERIAIKEIIINKLIKSK